MNPFSLPNTDRDLYLLSEAQREVNRAITAEERRLSIQYRRSKNQNTMLEELKQITTPKASTSYRSRRSQSCNRENIQELILRKREILMTKKKIEHKRASISFLNEITKTKEEEQKRAAKQIEDNLVMFEKYEEKLKSEAKEKAELADRKTKERTERQLKISKLELEIDYLFGQHERKMEIFRQLCVYKEFVEELSSQIQDKKSTTFITASKPQAHTPLSLLTSINSLEQKNLFLIQQAQEAEINFDNLKSRSKAEIKSLSEELETFKANIKIMEKAKEIYTAKLQTLLNEQVEDPLISPETMQKLHLALLEVFVVIGGDLTTYPTDFEILEILETAIRAEIEKTKLMDEEVLRVKERDVDKERRSRNVNVVKMKESQKMKEISESIEKRKRKVVKKNGRKNMDRSRLPEKEVVQEVKEIPQEVKDWKEFLEEDLVVGRRE